MTDAIADALSQIIISYRDLVEKQIKQIQELQTKIYRLEQKLRDKDL